MKKEFRLLIILAAFFTFALYQTTNGQAPPPPTHGQNGNQTSPGGGTGCPIDRTDGIIFTLLLSLGSAGFILYKRGEKKKEVL